uniref:Putative secreted protein n=1 Tax=Ixodes ricinus TaxID=34613 RepID=A0A6B0U6D2_IXORI
MAIFSLWLFTTGALYSNVISDRVQYLYIYIYLHIQGVSGNSGQIAPAKTAHSNEGGLVLFWSWAGGPFGRIVQVGDD